MGRKIDRLQQSIRIKIEQQKRHDEHIHSWDVPWSRECKEPPAMISIAIANLASFTAMTRKTPGWRKERSILASRRNLSTSYMLDRTLSLSVFTAHRTWNVHYKNATQITKGKKPRATTRERRQNYRCPVDAVFWLFQCPIVIHHASFLHACCERNFSNAR